ncbi:MAG: FAD:protein FMN transferase [Vicinamibacteria bacterium]|nr:FAD:protein FMN transferase [Vicinamibacteria bacterium]
MTVLETASALALASSLAAQADLGGESREFRYLMGTSVQIAAFGGDEASRKAAIGEAFGAIQEVDRLMSNYRADSELMQLNARASREPVTVGDPLFAVIAAAQEVSLRSGGAFDITVGPLVRLWGFHDKKPHIPDAAELQAVRPLISYRNLILDAAQHTIRFGRPGVEIDLGGIAKGFAVELAGGVMRRHGLSAFIDAGGNQYMVGRPNGKQSWTLGIKDPEAPEHLLGKIEVDEGSVSTSAQGSSFLIANGRKYGHILDPRTLEPAADRLSVTVVSQDATLGDALSKVGFLLGPTKGLAVIESFPGASAVIFFRNSKGELDLICSKALIPRLKRATQQP